MMDIIDTLTDSVSSAFSYYMYTGILGSDAKKQFFFVAEETLSVNVTQVNIEIFSKSILNLIQFSVLVNHSLLEFLLLGALNLLHQHAGKL